MYEAFRRRVRIIGEASAIGRKVTIEDVETGEMITNISKAAITLIPGEYNAVEFTYYELNETGHIITEQGEPVVRSIKLNFPDIDLIAYEPQQERSTHGEDTSPTTTESDPTRAYSG